MKWKVDPAMLTSIASILLNIIEKKMNHSSSLTLPMSDTDPANVDLIQRKGAERKGE